MPIFTPMLPVVNGVCDDPNFVHEVKWDGFRALAHLNDGIKLVSRNGKDLAPRFSKLIQALTNLNFEKTVFDGEVVALDRANKPSFSLLTSYPRLPSTIVYVIFDLLYFEGELLCPLPWYKRRKILEELGINAGPLFLSPLLWETGRESLNFAREQDLEGIVSKRKDSPYLPGVRSSDWRKQKLQKTLDCVVIGLKYRAKQISSLVIALYRSDGNLLRIGNVGSGLTAKERDFLREGSHLLLSDLCPVINPPRIEADILWLKPHLVVEVKYLEFTSYNKLRHPVFLRFRFDKKANECLLEGGD